MTIATIRITELYEHQIANLSAEERLYLLKLIADGLAATAAEAQPKIHSVLEFAGAGKHNPVGPDAQDYINELRKEWERRP